MTTRALDAIPIAFAITTTTIVIGDRDRDDRVITRATRACVTTITIA